MKPVDQAILNDTKNGDCFAACLASILELPLNKVPNYIAYDNWFEKFDDFVAEHGYRLFWYRLKDYNEYEDILGFTAKDVFVIMAGKSPRGDFDHCVVFQNDKMVHDPHPDKTGIENQKDVVVLVKINPGE